MTGDAPRALDDSGIRAIWDTMARGWETGSAALFASVFAEDVDFISVQGTTEKGRDRVRGRHAVLFDGPYRGTALDVRLELVRRLGGDTALVHASTRVTRPDASVVSATHAQAVLVREHGEWLVVAFHNMIPFSPDRTLIDRSPP